MVNGYRSISYVTGKSSDTWNGNSHLNKNNSNKSRDDVHSKGVVDVISSETNTFRTFVSKYDDISLRNLEQFQSSSDQPIRVIETTTFPSSPKVFGPGIWFEFHTMATLSLTNETMNIYIDHVKSIIDRLPCMKCRRDAQKYFDNDNPSKYKSTDNGMFYWSWKFHNTVNAKLGKPLLEWDTGLNMYLGGDDEVCSLECGT